MDELMNRYFENFGEAFPNFVFTGTENEMKEAIKGCLKDDKTYEPEYKKGITY